MHWLYSVHVTYNHFETIKKKKNNKDMKNNRSCIFFIEIKKYFILENDGKKKEYYMYHITVKFRGFAATNIPFSNKWIDKLL